MDERRLWDLEASFERLMLDNQDLRRKLTQALQQIRDVQAKPAGLTSITNPVYVAITPSGGIGAASADPSTGAPGSASCAIYKISGGAYVSVGTATVYNSYLTATEAAVKVVTVAINEDGTYTLLAESCV